jgi:hypothetical protein
VDIKPLPCGVAEVAYQSPDIISQHIGQSNRVAGDEGFPAGLVGLSLSSRALHPGQWLTPSAERNPCPLTGQDATPCIRSIVASRALRVLLNAGAASVGRANARPKKRVLTRTMLMSPSGESVAESWETATSNQREFCQWQTNWVTCRQQC